MKTLVNCGWKECRGFRRVPKIAPQKNY